MALKKCNECGNEVSNKAEKCPKCGNPIKKKSSAAGGCLAVIILTFIVIAVVGTMETGSSSYNENESSEKNPIDASITKNLTTLYITNQDAFVWPSAKIFVNGIMGGYRYEHGSSIEADATLEIDLINFTKRNGDRFQPYKTDVKEVIISVPGYDSPIYEY
jgi:hypothetical protein